MRKFNFPPAVFSALGGILLALAIFLPVGIAQKASANLPGGGGGWCPPPAGCANFGCMNNVCKFIAQENGASCHVGGDCSSPY